MEKEEVNPYYCLACGYISPVYQRSCPSCGIAEKFCTEKQYAELMMRYLHHPLRKYRIFSLKTIKKLKWKEAIPELEERVRIERDQDIKAEARRTLESLQIYLNRSASGSSPDSHRDPTMFTQLGETNVKLSRFVPFFEEKVTIISGREEEYNKGIFPASTQINYSQK